MPTPKDLKVGGALSLRLDCWKRVTSNRWVLSVIEKGLMLEFEAEAPGNRRWGFNRQAYTEEEYAFLSKVQRELRVERVVEEVFGDGKYEGVFQSFFTLPKKNSNERRPILNGKWLSGYLRYRHFKMDSMGTVRDILRKDDYMIKIDLSQAYHHVLIHPRFRKYLRYEWDGKVWQYRALPQGISCGYSPS